MFELETAAMCTAVSMTTEPVCVCLWACTGLWVHADSMQSWWTGLCSGEQCSKRILIQVHLLDSLRAFKCTWWSSSADGLIRSSQMGLLEYSSMTFDLSHRHRSGVPSWVVTVTLWCHGLLIMTMWYEVVFRHSNRTGSCSQTTKTKKSCSVPCSVEYSCL